MNILILGDIMGSSGRDAIIKKLPEIIIKKKIDFVIVNGENAADSGVGITKKNSEDFFKAGVDVITTGNHVWDQKETMEFINFEKRLLRPENLTKGSPGKGSGIFNSKNNKKIAVINLMGNVFMKKCEDVFKEAQKFIQTTKLKRDADFIIVDLHGETTSEKMAMGHLFDGNATVVVGTHTHIPTSDYRIMQKGTAYQTDIGMCGDYDSVIGMNKENSLKKFLKDPSCVKHYPATGEATISGLVINADEKTGLAKKVQPIIVGGILENKI
ncbi:TIGR00282 family metallophosphoesterase [bacterium]|nr:TIGR00282 family metallophosphoesterase [bacterium]